MTGVGSAERYTKMSSELTSLLCFKHFNNYSPVLLDNFAVSLTEKGKSG